MAEKKKIRSTMSMRAQRKRARGSEAHGRHYDASEQKNRISRNKVGSKKSNLLSLKFIIPLILVVFIVSSYIFVTINHPVGIFEYFTNLFASSGTGSGYDCEIYGGKPKYTIGADDKYYLVTDTSVNCYNKNGKTIFERSHVYSDPVINVAETRYILYGQSESELTVNTLTDNLYTRNFEHNIISASICDEGSYCVATKADGYDSVVYVFDKNNNKVYEWYSSGEMVSALSLSRNGSTLAVATISVDNGKFVSKIYFLRFDSADAIIKCEYTDDIVYGLYESGSNVFCVVFSDSIEFINYKSNTTKSYKSEYAINIVKSFSDCFVVLRSVDVNQDQSVIEIYDRRGEKVSTLNINSSVTDFSYKSGNLYLLETSKVRKYDTDGNLCSESDVNFDSLYIEYVSDNNVACIRNSTIEKITLNDMEEK